jgi:hypothetical protein
MPVVVVVNIVVVNVIIGIFVDRVTAVSEAAAVAGQQQGGPPGPAKTRKPTNGNAAGAEVVGRRSVKMAVSQVTPAQATA